MEETLTLKDLQDRWEKTLSITEKLVVRDPNGYSQIKELLKDIVTKTVDICHYEDTAIKLDRLLTKIDDASKRSIFYFFSDRFSPFSISKMRLFRIECRDLLDQLKAFEDWRIEKHHLIVFK
jgi:hypothetical protein